MKKITLSIITSITLLSNTLHADWWQSTKEVVNKAEFWKSKHLSDIDFEHVYPKKFYKKDSFGYILTGIAIVGAGAVSYFSAGAGAPAAATGVSSVASLVAGGGAGSYMAGLSTIGGWFGGNAMLGAAILNGISIGILEETGAKALQKLSHLDKVAKQQSLTATFLDGIVYYKNLKTNKFEYRIKLTIPKNLGSKETRDLVDTIYDIEEEIQKDNEDNQGKNNSYLLSKKQRIEQEALILLKEKLYQSDNQEDLIVLGIIASNNSEYSLFKQAVNKIESSELDNTSFLNYLKALTYLYEGNNKKALEYLDNSIAENPYALEPIILSINILGENFLQNETKIEALVKKAEENFDSDDYATEHMFSGVLYRVATLYFNHKRFISAQHYYEKAYDELGLLQKNFFGKELAHTIELGTINALYQQNKFTVASERYKELIEDIDEEKDEEKKKIQKQYLGNK
jgi:tetratricopeptide (TPR) repeat protein